MLKYLVMKGVTLKLRIAASCFCVFSRPIVQKLTKLVLFPDFKVEGALRK